MGMTETNNDVPVFVTQAKASFLLGISEAELREVSEELGVGQLERAGNEQKLYFTYEDLQRIFLVVCPTR
jgi:hypothetical protein